MLLYLSLPLFCPSYFICPYLSFVLPNRWPLILPSSSTFCCHPLYSMLDIVWRRYVCFPYVTKGTECGCCSVDPTGQWQRTESANNFITWERLGKNGLKWMIHGPHSALFLSLCKDQIVQFVTLRPPCLQNRSLWMLWTAGRNSLCFISCLSRTFFKGWGYDTVCIRYFKCELLLWFWSLWPDT